MKINKLSFKDCLKEWQFDDFEFNRLTLMVGASGVGKTRILQSILQIAKIAKGESINGINFSIEFSVNQRNSYRWICEFESVEASIFEMQTQLNDSKNKPQFKISKEQIWYNSELIIDRTPKNILFRNQPIVKLAMEQSIVALLKEEKEIKPIYEAFKKIQTLRNTEDFGISLDLLMILSDKEKYIKKLKTLKKIRNFQGPIQLKLYCASVLQDTSIFDSIKTQFIEVFPNVEDIKVAPIQKLPSNFPRFFEDFPFIQIKEKGVKQWITQDAISSGMLKTLIYLSELALCPDNAIFLVDEFENSLGVNCIGSLTDSIMETTRNIQFIITSHHPYIINNIPIQDWKLVTRIGGHVYEHNCNQLELGKSKHDAFMQLIQLDAFTSGTISKTETIE